LGLALLTFALLGSQPLQLGQLSLVFMELLLLCAQSVSCLGVSLPSKLQLSFDLHMTVLAPALSNAELLQLGVSLLEVVRELFRTETMRDFALVEFTLTLRERVRGLRAIAPGNRQFVLELTRALLSLTLLSPELVQLVSQVPKLSLPRFRFKL